MLSGPLASGTSTYYLITCLHVLVQFSSACSGLLDSLFTCCCTAVLLYCHTLVVIHVVHYGAH